MVVAGRNPNCQAHKCKPGTKLCAWWNRCTEPYKLKEIITEKQGVWFSYSILWSSIKVTGNAILSSISLIYSPSASLLRNYKKILHSNDHQILLKHQTNSTESRLQAENVANLVSQRTSVKLRKIFQRRTEKGAGYLVFAVRGLKCLLLNLWRRCFVNMVTYLPPGFEPTSIRTY